MKIKKFTFSPIQENTYVVYDETGQCVIIDPGCSNEAERQKLAHFIHETRLSPVKLLNTHCHIDHVAGNKFVMETYNIGLLIHRNELPILHEAPKFSRFFGLECPPSPEPEAFIDENSTVAFGDTIFTILFTPGHSPGSICFYNEAEKKIFSGDVLFLGGIGRYDLPGANGADLFKSLDEIMMCLPDDVTVYSGHGPETTIGNERSTNPYLNPAFRDQL
jgi:hydroxyacylglutathione hydrolase